MVNKTEGSGSHSASSSQNDGRELDSERVRARALDALRNGRLDVADEIIEAKDEVEMTAVIESLRIYQAELQIQNEELKRSQVESRRALERFAAFFSRLPIAELIVDERGLVTESNLAAQRLFNLTNAHLHHHYFTRLVAEPDRAEMVRAWNSMNAREGLYLEEIRFRGRGEEGFIGDLHIAPLISPSDEVYHYVCAVIDRTEAVEQRLALYEASERLRRSEADLKARVVDLQLLHDVLHATARPGEPMQRVLSRVAERLAAACRRADLAEVRLEIPGLVCETDGFKPGTAAHSAMFALSDGESGELCIAYREPPSALEASDEPPIEPSLLVAIGAHIAVYVERQREQEALRESRERYRVLAEYSSDWEYWLAPDGQYRYVSPACETITGYSARELADDPGLLARIIHADDRAAWQRHVDEALCSHTADAAALELRIRTRDGHEGWIEHRCNPVVGVGGAFLGRRGIFRDISERKKIEAQLQQLSMAVEQSPESILITDTSGRIEYVNDAFVAVSGYAREELLGRNPRLLKSGQTSPETYAAIWGALRRGEIWKGELVNRRKNGMLYHESAVISPIRGADGRSTHYLAVKTDITEKKRLEEEIERHREHLEDVVASRTVELRQKSHSLQALIDNLPHMAWMKDCAGRFVAVNRAVADLAGAAPEEMVGKTDHDFWPEHQAAYYYKTDLEVMRTCRQQTLEEEAPTLGGSLFQTFKAPILDDDGSVLGTVGISHDVKPQREMELELERRAHQAESAARAKSAFLANMSHEIRTPMNAILGLTHLVRRDVVKTINRERLDKIDAAARHLLTVINDILDLSKIEAGKLQLERGDFALDSLLEQVRSLVQDSAALKGLALTIASEAAGVWLRGDLTRLRQALINYASNAIKFTERGAVSLRARVIAEDAEALTVRFEVQDSGIGIDPAALRNLFQAFEQADVSTTRRFGGTGLGLAINRQLAQLMGGEVGAESEPGVGSTFWLTARLARGVPGAASGEVAAGESGAELRARCAGCRILLAEDNAVNREVAQELLGSLGLVVDAAVNGAQALEMAGADPSYVLILMDVQMPVMDGLAATRALRRLPAWRDKPILALTANAFADDRRDCLEAGMNDFVAKPVDPAALFDALARWLPTFPTDAATVAATRARDASDDDPEPGILARLDASPDVDAQRGLDLMGGCADKYLGLLVKLVDSHAADPAAMSAALERGDLGAVHRFAHALKGVAGTLGVTRIAGLASRLTTLARAEPPACSAEVDQLVTELAAAFGALSALLERSPEPPRAAAASVPVDSARLSSVLDRLLGLLEQDSPKAQQVLREHEALLRAALGHDFEPIERRLTQFDLEEALALVRQSSNRLSAAGLDSGIDG